MLSQNNYHFGNCNNIAGMLFNYLFFPIKLPLCFPPRLPQLVTGKRFIAVSIANNVDGSYCKCLLGNSLVSQEVLRTDVWLLLKLKVTLMQTGKSTHVIVFHIEIIYRRFCIATSFAFWDIRTQDKKMFVYKHKEKIDYVKK